MSLPQCFPFTHKWRERSMVVPRWQRWERRTTPKVVSCAVCGKVKVR